MPALLSTGNPKIELSDNAGLGYLTKILHLAPATVSGYDTCPWSSPGCRAACLNKSGRGNCTPVQNARIRKTRLLFENKSAFKNQLYDELSAFVRKCRKLGVRPAARLNGTSDIDWGKELPDMFVQFPQIQFYDYTKDSFRALVHKRQNYHFTFSKTESNNEACLKLLKMGINVAVVFRNEIPKTWHGFPVHSGMETDLRFLDPFGVCGLLAKGKAKYDKSGFVEDTQ